MHRSALPARFEDYNLWAAPHPVPSGSLPTTPRLAAGTNVHAPSHKHTGARPQAWLGGSPRAVEKLSMTKNMLIDAAHAEETRVAVVDGQRVEEFDFESRARKQLRGNIYLAKVTRVEPSLQAAFIEYGGNRHGFLAFNEIHPDYYQIPVADRQAIMAEADDDDDHLDAEDHDDEDEGVSAEEAKLRRRMMRRYKIQEVIKRRQILLVQVVKEERGSKGAALTTYMSLAGRYCVLMPNTARGGGISRKITQAVDRKRLKAAAASLEVPQGMGLIIRTAGAKRTKLEIKRDYDYLLRLWESIRETTLKSNAPALIYEEEDLVKRAIRDMYDKDIDAVIVDGEDGYREAREFMRMLMPSQLKKILPYDEPTPLFVKYKVEDVLQQIHSPTVPLKSGGYLVINQTEALVAVDVNSGRATKERNIEATALKTNLEAADETARQLRLRDLAGLIVIDFIDMDESKNNRAVEKRLKDALAGDRARIQMGKISSFGLMEISRQRRRSGVLEGTTHVCEACQGIGRIRSVESSALQALRAVEMEVVRGGAGVVELKVPSEVALYILNQKRAFLARLHIASGLFVTVMVDDTLARADHAIERAELAEVPPPPAVDAIRGAGRYYETSTEGEEDLALEDEEFEDEDEEIEDAEEREATEGGTGEEADAPRGEDRGDGRGRGRGRRRRRGGRGEEREARGPAELRAEGDAVSDDEEDDGAEGGEAFGSDDERGPDGQRKRRRRGRRGGRRSREEGTGRDAYAWTRARTPSLDDPYVWFDPIELAAGGRPPREEGAEPRQEPRQEARPERAPEARADAPREGRDGGEAREGRSRRGRGRGRGRGRDGERGVERAGEGAGAEEAREETLAAVGETLIETVAITPPVPEPVIEAEAPKRRRVRAKKPQAAETGADIGAEAAVAGVIEAPEPAPAPVAEPVQEQAPEPAPAPQPEPVLADAEPAAPAEPDPSEIAAPPPQPKRGWWRKLG
jgi:ribonuclease E